MPTTTFDTRRGALRDYFDATAADAWAQLTSDAPVSKIRATVRAGRDEMRGNILSWLPEDLKGARVLDAGCGTGALSVAAARRGADVTGIDIAPNLLAIARERTPDILGPGAVEYAEGDMLDASFGAFDFIVGMDSLIHYNQHDILSAIEQLSARAGTAIIFTVAPKTPALSAMHAVGRLFPRADRAPAIVPVAPSSLKRSMAEYEGLSHWRPGREARVSRGFYTSHALELTRA